jgi:hypothetical protein
VIIPRMVSVELKPRHECDVPEAQDGPWICPKCYSTYYQVPDGPVRELEDQSPPLRGVTFSWWVVRPDGARYPCIEGSPE